MMNENLDPQTDERLSAYLDDELTTDERAEFEAILAARSDYQEALARLQRTRKDFQGLPLQQLSETAHQQILGRIRDASQPVPETRFRGWRVRSLAIAATLAAGFLLAVTLFSRPQERQLAQAERAGANRRDRVTESAEATSDSLRAAPEAEAGEQLMSGRGAVSRMRASSGSAGELADLDTAEPAAESVVVDGRGRGATRSGFREGPGDEGAPDEGSADDARELPPSAITVTAAPTTSPPDTSLPDMPLPSSAIVAEAFSAAGQVMAGDMPEIILQANSRQGYEFLLASLAQAKLDAELPGDAPRQQGYFQTQAQVGRQQPMPAQVQVLEVTSTPSDIAQLVQSAQTQGAVLLNAVTVEQQLPELNQNQTWSQPPERAARARRQGGKEQKSLEAEEADRSSFQGVINNWVQVDTAAPQEESSDALAAVAVDEQRQVHQRQFQRRLNEATRWRIKILPHPESPAMSAPTAPGAPPTEPPPPG